MGKVHKKTFIFFWWGDTFGEKYPIMNMFFQFVSLFGGEGHIFLPFYGEGGVATKCLNWGGGIHQNVRIWGDTLFN